MTDFKPGATIGGRYRIETLIGHGGLTTVYRALDIRHNRFVALKFLHSYFADDPEFKRRFRSEAKLQARLRHPGIVQVYDVGEVDGQLYMALEYIEGGNLADWIVIRGPMPVDVAVQVVVQVGNALAYIHKQGLIHRDVKPSNILMANDGRIHLSDLGIAMQPGSSMTQTGTIVGTPAYMSPEHAQGKRLDARSDIFSLGLVLYQLLTGRAPFETDSTLAVLYSVIHESPPPLRQFRPDIPPYLEGVVLKAIAKDPAKRFQTADEFVVALQRVSERRPTDAMPTMLSPAPRKRSAAAPRRAVVVLAALVFGIVLAALLWPALLSPQVPLSTPIAGFLTPLPTPSRTPFPTSFPLPPTPPPAGVQGGPSIAYIVLIALIVLSVVVFALLYKPDQLRHEAVPEVFASPAMASPSTPAYTPSVPKVAPTSDETHSSITSETYPLDADIAQKTMIMRRAPEVAAFLLVLNGPQRGQQLTIARQEVSIGRGSGQNDICIDDPLLSREHARIRLESNRFVIYDLASTNGTFVNGQLILRETLRDRDEIRVGNTNMIFVNIAADVSQDAKQRLREFDSTWNDLTKAARYER